MFFKKKKIDSIKCEDCGSKISDNFSFCPHCGNSLIDEEDHSDYGLLGKNDRVSDSEFSDLGLGENKIADKLIGTIFNSLVKNLDKQFRELDREMEETEGSGSPEIRELPNGISIRLGSPSAMQKQPKKKKTDPFKKRPTEKQIKELTKLPKKPAKSSVKRIGDKVVYELATPGVSSVNDVFISKLESGYEIKAIGDKRVYVNSLPVNLPIKQFSIGNNKLSVEFLNHEGQ